MIDMTGGEYCIKLEATVTLWLGLSTATRAPMELESPSSHDCLTPEINRWQTPQTSRHAPLSPPFSGSPCTPQLPRTTPSPSSNAKQLPAMSAWGTQGAWATQVRPRQQYPSRHTSSQGRVAPPKQKRVGKTKGGGEKMRCHLWRKKKKKRRRHGRSRKAARRDG